MILTSSRGELRRELHKALRTGRARRKPRRQAQRRQPRFMDPMVMISDRPAEAADRAIPGHWEGDLIIGKNQRSAIATLVERSTRYLMLVHLPHDHSAGAVRKALVENITTLPTQLRRSLTWDQGSEMGQHKAFTVATDMPVYFCDPASPTRNTRPRKTLDWDTPAERLAKLIDTAAQPPVLQRSLEFANCGGFSVPGEKSVFSD